MFNQIVFYFYADTVAVIVFLMSESCFELNDTVTVRRPSFSGVKISLCVTFFSLGSTSLQINNNLVGTIKTVINHSITAVNRVIEKCGVDHLILNVFI